MNFRLINVTKAGKQIIFTVNPKSKPKQNIDSSMIYI